MVRLGVIVAIVFGTVSGGALDPVCIGRWKMNADKSFAGTASLSFVETQQGEIRVEGAVVPTTTFRFDGQDYPAGGGVTTAWTRIDAHTWTAVHKSNGKIATTDRVTLSPDERTLTVARTGSRAEMSETFVLTRESGSTGLIGNWRASAVTGAEVVVELSPFGEDGLSIKLLPGNEIFNLHFDGRDYPLTGANAPSGIALSLKQTGPRSFDVTQKQNGRPMFTTSYVVSADGKTLNTIGRNEESGQTVRLAYDRQ